MIAHLFGHCVINWARSKVTKYELNTIGVRILFFSHFGRFIIVTMEIHKTQARARTRSVLLNLKRKAMCKNTAKFESEFINSLKENTSELKAAKKIELISSVELRKRISNQAILQ